MAVDLLKVVIVEDVLQQTDILFTENVLSLCAVRKKDSYIVDNARKFLVICYPSILVTLNMGIIRMVPELSNAKSGRIRNNF